MKTKYGFVLSLRKRKKKKEKALAGVAQWIEHWPANQRVTSLVPSQGMCLGPRWGCARSNHTLMSFPLSFSIPSPLSKNKENLKKKFGVHSSRFSFLFFKVYFIDYAITIVLDFSTM